MQAHCGSNEGGALGSSANHYTNCFHFCKHSSTWMWQQLQNTMFILTLFKTSQERKTDVANENIKTILSANNSKRLKVEMTEDLPQCSAICLVCLDVSFRRRLLFASLPAKGRVRPCRSKATGIPHTDLWHQSKQSSDMVAICQLLWAVECF